MNKVRQIEHSLKQLHQHNRWFQKMDAGLQLPKETTPVEGVNVAGYFRDESGWGSAGRRYLRALRASNVPLALMDISSITSNRSEDTDEAQFDALHPYDINLICVDARHHYGMLSKVGTDFFDNKYNIGIWAWELPRFPDSLYDRFAYYDEIWVATSFIANVIAPISPVPVVCVPPVLTALTTGCRKSGRAMIKGNPEDFVFLFIFDFHSHLARKNPEAILQAFLKAFEPHEKARLILKCVNENSDIAGFRRLQKLASQGNVDLHCGYWSASEIRDLTQACDVYISLHRSEGTGLTISDAMALGKPVIATDWSGNTDFMDVSNSLPVRYILREIEQTVGPYQRGETWAEPSVDHAAELMRLAFDDRDLCNSLGRNAQSSMEAHYSEQAVGSLISSRLATICANPHFDEYRSTIKTFYRSYQALAEVIQSIAMTALPLGSTVAVISKGDPKLVELKGHQGWHFPRTCAGVYSGYHPAESQDAILELKKCCAQGAQYLLIPGTSLWWLDHYKSFAEYLSDTHQCIWSDDRCVIFDLVNSPADSCDGVR